MEGEAMVARGLASIKMSPIEFYVLHRVYSRKLPPTNTQGIVDELQPPGNLIGPDKKKIVYADVRSVINRMIKLGYLLRKKRGQSGILSLSDTGMHRFHISFAMTIIPLPEWMKTIPGMPDRKLVKLRHRGNTTSKSYGLTLFELRRLFARITPERLRDVLAEYGIEPCPWGNQSYNPSELDASLSEAQGDTGIILVDGSKASRHGSDPVAAVSSKAQPKVRDWRPHKNPSTRRVQVNRMTNLKQWADFEKGSKKLKYYMDLAREQKIRLVALGRECRRLRECLRNTTKS
jgi:hypothetical protein